MSGVVQMNVRIDSALKQQGDKIFQRQGLTPSQAVRRMWEYVVEHNRIPDFMCDTQADAREAAKQHKLALAKTGAGLATRLAYPNPSARPEGPSIDEIVNVCRSMDDVYDDMHENMLEMFAEYEEDRAQHAN